MAEILDRLYDSARRTLTGRVLFPVLVLVLGGLLGGLGALCYGFSPDWDLLNYHLYNPHALLHGRWAVDVAPAQQQTYLNPALHLPGYLLFKYTSSAVLVVVTGAVQGSQLVLLYYVLAELVDRERFRGWLLLAVAALGLGGPIFQAQLGGSQGDTLLSVLVLAALLAMLREQKRLDATRTFKTGLLCGFLLGAACGLKLTMAPYGAGLLAASFMLLGGVRRWKITAGIGLGGLLGMGLLSGPWFAWLWHNWESPLFPYFNRIFHSSWVGAETFRDMRFLPRTAGEWLFYPYYWSLDPLKVWEYRFRDLRLPALFTLSVLLPLVLSRRLRQLNPALALTWLFVILSYLLWLKLFSIYRYLSVIELLAPLLIFGTLVGVFRQPRTAAIACALLLLSQVLVKFDRRPSTWLFQADSETALAELPTDAMIVIDGYEPVAYAALWLDDRIPLVRIRSNFMSLDIPVTRVHAMADRRVIGHHGPRYLLSPATEQSASLLDRDLARVGLSVGDRSSCLPVFRHVELQRMMGLRLCALEPLAAARESGYPGGR